MISEVLKNAPMSENCETIWFPMRMKRVGAKRSSSATSLQILWTGATGTLNGKLKIYASNNSQTATLAHEISINTASNADDALLLVFFTSDFEGIKIKYERNDISGGELNAAIFYSETE